MVLLILLELEVDGTGVELLDLLEETGVEVLLALAEDDEGFGVDEEEEEEVKVLVFKVDNGAEVL